MPLGHYDYPRTVAMMELNAQIRRNNAQHDADLLRTPRVSEVASAVGVPAVEALVTEGGQVNG